MIQAKVVWSFDVSSWQLWRLQGIESLLPTHTIRWNYTQNKKSVTSNVILSSFLTIFACISDVITKDGLTYFCAWTHLKKCSTNVNKLNYVIYWRPLQRFNQLWKTTDSSPRRSDKVDVPFHKNNHTHLHTSSVFFYNHSVKHDKHFTPSSIKGEKKVRAALRWLW